MCIYRGRNKLLQKKDRSNFAVVFLVVSFMMKKPGSICKGTYMF